MPIDNGGAIAAAQAEKAQVQAEVAEMQVKRDEWVKAEMLAKLERYGSKARPWVRINERARAFRDRSDYRVPLDY